MSIMQRHAARFCAPMKWRKRKHIIGGGSSVAVEKFATAISVTTNDDGTTDGDSSLGQLLVGVGAKTCYLLHGREIFSEMSAYSCEHSLSDNQYPSTSRPARTLTIRVRIKSDPIKRRRFKTPALPPKSGRIDSRH